MSLNPANPDDRRRLSKALDYAHQEISKFNRARAVTIKAYLGISDDAIESLTGSWTTKSYQKRLPKGNLLQLSGLSHQIALAYGEPRVMVKARTSEHRGLANTLGPALNRMAALLDLGETHRNVAADSYFGYGVYKTGVGYLPEAARIATGLTTGPCIWRVSQSDFLFDITAKDWNRIAYVGDLYTMDLKDAQALYPKSADKLSAYVDSDRLDGRIIFPKASRYSSPHEDVWMLDIYFPSAKAVATWPVRASSFGAVDEEPLIIRDYDGHWSGIYQVLTHLYSPDELVPIAQAESVKSLHFLFNNLLHLTSEQALNAKVNPMYRVSSERDMMRLWGATDRHPVGVTNPTDMLGLFEIPGPSQPQTAYLSSLFNIFKEMTPTYDEPQRAPTATQGTLERQATNAIIAEARRKDIRALQLVYYKLGHLLLNNQDIVLPAERPLLPGSRISVPATFGPNQRNARIDDFDISIEPFSTVFRSPDERLQFLLTASQAINQAMMMAAQGAPINVEKVIETFAELGNEPILREWYEPADPRAQVLGRQSERSAPRVGVGQYTQTHLSSRTTAGALEQSLAQMGGQNGVPTTANEGA